MENKPVIAIDVDGVLRNNLPIIVDLYNKEFNENLIPDDIKDFRTEVSFPKIETVLNKKPSDWLFQEHSLEVFRYADPFPNITDDIKFLRETASVIIITYQKSVKNKIHTLEWLDDNNIEYDGIFFAKNKTIINCDYFVDDNDWNFVNSIAKCGVLIDAPYNIDKNIIDVAMSGNCNRMMRCHDFHEFVEKYKQKEIIL